MDFVKHGTAATFATGAGQNARERDERKHAEDRQRQNGRRGRADVRKLLPDGTALKYLLAAQKSRRESKHSCDTRKTKDGPFATCSPYGLDWFGSTRGYWKPRFPNQSMNQRSKRRVRFEMAMLNTKSFSVSGGKERCSAELLMAIGDVASKKKDRIRRRWQMSIRLPMTTCSIWRQPLTQFRRGADFFRQIAGKREPATESGRTNGTPQEVIERAVTNQPTWNEHDLAYGEGGFHRTQGLFISELATPNGKSG